MRRNVRWVGSEYKTATSKVVVRVDCQKLKYAQANRRIQDGDGGLYQQATCLVCSCDDQVSSHEFSQGLYKNAACVESGSGHAWGFAVRVLWEVEG